MEHYFHHCEINPEKFRELLAENLEKESIADTLKRARSLKANREKNKVEME